MVVLMGGRNSQGYQNFQSLAVRAFLAIRPYAEQIIDTIQLMLDSGLPSFKGESTIRRLRDRFSLNMNERHAAETMMGIIRNAHENVRSTVYDEFQRVGLFCFTLTLDLLIRLTFFTAPKRFVCFLKCTLHTITFLNRYSIQVVTLSITLCEFLQSLKSYTITILFAGLAILYLEMLIFTVSSGGVNCRHYSQVVTATDSNEASVPL